MISYYWTHRQNPILKFKLKKKLGDEWKKVEQKTKDLNMIYNYWTIVHTKKGTVIAENNTLVYLANLLSFLISAASFILTLCRNTFALPAPIKYVLLGVGIASLLAGGIIMFLGFKNDERHIVDMGTPFLCSGLIGLGASFFW